MSAYGFSEDSARRISRVVKSVEGDTTTPTRIGPMLGGSTMSVVCVTSLGSPLSTGQRIDYHAGTNTLVDQNEILIRELNGATLTKGARYTGQFSGYSSDSKPVFVVKEWSTVSIVRVTSLGSPLSTGQRMDYSANTDTFTESGEVKIREFSGLPLTVNTRYMGQFSGYDSSGIPVFVVKTAASSGGSAVIDVVTDVTCGPAGLSLSTVTLSGADYDNAVIRNFLALNDVTVKSFTANQGRVVKVNNAATGLEFGPIIDADYTTFIALSDTPSDYGSSAYKTLTVGSSSTSIVFSDNNVATKDSVRGGGNPSGPDYVAISLVNDVSNPGNYYAYSTNAFGVKGWNLQAATPAGLTVGGNVVVSSRKASVADVANHTISNADLATTASTTQTAIDDLKTQVNLLLARIRSHGLIS